LRYSDLLKNICLNITLGPLQIKRLLIWVPLFYRVNAQSGEAMIKTGQMEDVLPISLHRNAEKRYVTERLIGQKSIILYLRKRMIMKNKELINLNRRGWGKEMLKKKSLWFYMFAFIVVIAACSETTTKNVEDTKSASNSDPSSVSDLDPSDPMTPYIKDGEKIFNETDTMLPEKVGNEMACMSCHADGGTSQGSTLVGVTGQYPKYQPRAGTVQTIEERINSCMVRSMNGEKLEYDG